MKASAKLLGPKFVWPGLRKDVRAWAAVCVACQRAKVTRHTKAPMALFKVPERRFDHVNVDLVGPLSPSRGYTYLLTMVDRTTRWPQVVPLYSTTAAEVARAFVMDSPSASLGSFFWTAASHRAVSRDIADAFVPIPTSQHGLPRSYVPTDLPSAKYVFIRHDGHRTLLRPPYDGPFRFLEGRP